MKNSKFYIFLIFIGIILFSYNYWGDFVKVSLFEDFKNNEEIDLSWLSTYEKTNNKVLRNVDISDNNFENLEKISRKKIEILDEKEAFVSASYKASCLVFSANGVYNKVLEEQTKNVFIEYGFEPDNSLKMKNLINKYLEDEDYLKAVLSASINCVCKEGEVFSFLEFKCVK